MSALFVARAGTGDRGRLVAVKVVRQRRQNDVESLLRARDAGRQLAALQHRHIVSVEEIADVGGFPALVSPWVDGVDLLDWVEVLRETGQLMPGRVVCEIVRSCAVALDAAWSRPPPGETEPQRRSHRDLKPTNVMVDRDGELKVVDWGTGFTALAGRQARNGALQKGLVKYLSPERREGKRGGTAADIYALGILGIELFRGRWLRRLRSQNPAHDRHLAEVVAAMGDPGTRTSADEATLRSMLLRMVAFDPEARPLPSEVAATFRTLTDRSPGPSLESYAHDHALPWIDPVPSVPEPGLEAGLVRLLDTGASWSDLSSLDQFQQSALGRSVEEHDWEETDNGWRRSEDEEDDLEGNTSPTLPNGVESVSLTDTVENTLPPHPTPFADLAGEIDGPTAPSSTTPQGAPIERDTLADAPPLERATEPTLPVEGPTDLSALQAPPEGWPQPEVPVDTTETPEVTREAGGTRTPVPPRESSPIEDNTLARLNTPEGRSVVAIGATVAGVTLVVTLGLVAASLWLLQAG